VKSVVIAISDISMSYHYNSNGDNIVVHINNYKVLKEFLSMSLFSFIIFLACNCLTVIGSVHACFATHFTQDPLCTVNNKPTHRDCSNYGNY